MPVSLFKSDDEEWRIQGLASTQSEDLQGEVVVQKGLDISELKAGRGLFNYDHKEGPENLLGVIEDADFVKEGLKVNGYLFKHSPRAKAFYDIMRSLKPEHRRRVQMSIEGKILKRAGEDGSQIAQAKVEKVALTVDPVNTDTYVEMVKSLKAEEPKDNDDKLRTTLKFLGRFLFLKALSAGTGYVGAPTDMSGGAALGSESLDRKLKDLKGKALELLNKLREENPELKEEEILDMVRAMSKKFAE